MKKILFAGLILSFVFIYNPVNAATTIGTDINTDGTVTSTTATSTNLSGTSFSGFGISTCNSGSSALIYSGGRFGCNTISGGSASSTLLGDTNFFSGTSNTFGVLNFTFATGTAVFTTTASSTNLWAQSFNGAGISTCNSASNALTWNAGRFGCNTIASGGGTPNSKWATSTLSDIMPNGGGGVIVAASSTFSLLNILNSTSTNSTSTSLFGTNLFSTIHNTTNLIFVSATGTNATTSNSLFSQNLFSNLSNLGQATTTSVFGNNLFGNNGNFGTLVSTSATSTNLYVSRSTSFGSTTPNGNSPGTITIGSNGANGTTTIYMGRIQFDGYDATGAPVCTFVGAGSVWVIIPGRCTK